MKHETRTWLAYADEMDLMDSIYLPSKYPAFSALPHTMPEREICRDALQIARSVRVAIQGFLGSSGVQ